MIGEFITGVVFLIALFIVFGLPKIFDKRIK
jgi:hypothetical protein